MAYWFHRNPLKATAAVNFGMKMVVMEREAISMCDELKIARASFLDLLSDPNNSVESVSSSAQTYLSLLQGLVLDEKRFALRFRWTDSILGNTPTAKQDVLFELASICLNLGIWYSKHAAMLAARDEVSMEQAKDVHTCLRSAAGIFEFVRDQGGTVEGELPQQGSDLDPKVLGAYIDQCRAEAQEVAIARAVELNHSPSLISSLAAETSGMYSKAEAALSSLDPKKFGKWRLYFRTKSTFYLSLAYCYCGEGLLAQERCGDAVRALQESLTLYANAEQLCGEYGKCKGPGTRAKPAEHPFFKRLGPIVKRTLDKCVRENGFIYHQKVADNPPQLDMHASYGLAQPEPFRPPEPSAKWTPLCSAAFAGTPRSGAKDPANSKAAVAAEGELPPVPEVGIHQSQNAPKNQSGCSIQ